MIPTNEKTQPTQDKQQPTWQNIKAAWVSFWEWFDDYNQTLAAYVLLLIATWYHTRAGFAIFEAGQYKWWLAGIIALVFETSTFRITKQLGRHLAANPATKEWSQENFRDRWLIMETLGLVMITFASIYFQTVNAVENGRNFDTLNTGEDYPDLFLWLLGIFLAGATLSVLHIVFASLLAKAEIERLLIKGDTEPSHLQATVEQLQVAIKQLNATSEEQRATIGQLASGLVAFEESTRDTCPKCEWYHFSNKVKAHKSRCKGTPPGASLPRIGIKNLNGQQK